MKFHSLKTTAGEFNNSGGGGGPGLLGEEREEKTRKVNNVRDAPARGEGGGGTMRIE